MSPERESQSASSGLTGPPEEGKRRRKPKRNLDRTEARKGDRGAEEQRRKPAQTPTQSRNPQGRKQRGAALKPGARNHNAARQRDFEHRPKGEALRGGTK